MQTAKQHHVLFSKFLEVLLHNVCFVRGRIKREQTHSNPLIPDTGLGSSCLLRKGERGNSQKMGWCQACLQSLLLACLKLPTGHCAKTLAGPLLSLPQSPLFQNNQRTTTLPSRKSSVCTLLWKHLFYLLRQNIQIPTVSMKSHDPHKKNNRLSTKIFVPLTHYRHHYLGRFLRL